MKIIVKNTFEDKVASTSSRCSDGHYRSSTYTKSINVYSDSETITVSIAKIILSFIDKHTRHETYKVWDWSYEGAYSEKFNSELTDKLIVLLESSDIIKASDNEKVDILLNDIALNIYNQHLSIVSDLGKEQEEIQKKFQLEKEKCNANFAIKSFYASELQYHLNKTMLDFGEFPLDIARISGDIEFLDYLIGKGAISVKDSNIFAEWLCEIGKFEYLDLFVDLAKIKINKNGDGDKVSLSFIFYSIVHNKLELYYEYGKISSNEFIDRICYNGPKSPRWKVGVGQIAVNYSNNTTINELFKLHKLSFYTSNRVLDNYCFRDKKTTIFFLNELFADSVFGLLYWDKKELLNDLIQTNISDFSKIYLSSFREFFKPENNYIIELLASKNSYSLTKLINEENNDLIPLRCRYDRESMQYSVIENCVIQKNTDLAKKLFSISYKKEKIESFDACRLLFVLYEYDEDIETEDFKETILKLIETDDLMKLAGVACIEGNLNLLKFLIPQIKDINSHIEIDPPLFGLQLYNWTYFSEMKYKNGTLLHLLLVAGASILKGCMKLELSKILLNAGIDISIKDESGKVAFDYIKYNDTYLVRDSQKNELIEILFTQDTKICSKDGSLLSIFENTKIPQVERFKSYRANGLSPIEAYKKNNKEALNFFLTCGAELDSLKSSVEDKKRRNVIIRVKSNHSYGDSYSEQELRDMHRDAFDGFDDAVWNID